MDESYDDDYVLELCDLLEEYKELSERKHHENQLLQEAIETLTQERDSLLSKNDEQSKIIDDLQNNITELVSDIDSMSLVLSSKDKDISNLSNCLYLMHEKKINIDDSHSLEQVRYYDWIYNAAHIPNSISAPPILSCYRIR